MNSNRGLWSDLPLSTGIATLVCYAGIFNDVIGIEELASRLGVAGKDEFNTTLNELSRQGKLVLKDGFAGLPNLEDKIALKAAKIETAHQLIKSRLDALDELARSPLIRFVGISGSLAAENPTRDQDNYLDMDVFLITRSQCLWRYNLMRGIRRHLSRSKVEPELCINYIMDESNLMITNRNLFTATEIHNLIPVSGLETYRKFLQANSWVDYYYPGLSGAPLPVDVAPSDNLINKCFFILFAILKSIQSLKLDPLKRIAFKTGAHIGSSLNLFSQPYGGYQALVHKKFVRLAKAWFPELFDADLIEKLFPDELSAVIRKGDIDVARIVLDAGLGTDYSKYGW
jgi:hypothetical protein